ncbi:MAG: quinolinate synthase NadA [Hornefia sp.]|nr:quinolinate synthase NadA [Hornefia sp.]
MDTKSLQRKIIKIKKEKDICILAHAYQSHDILEIADYTGDSFGLSKKAEKTESKTVVMCGVEFMAETVKILSPEKKVILASESSSCPMAMQYTAEKVKALKRKYPEYAVAAYINTTAELKTAADVVVTSSSAVKILNNMENKNIIFLPDPNLGGWLGKKLPDKNIRLFDGGCPVHMTIERRDVEIAKEKHPHALVLVHPEAKETVAELADFVGSTTEIMDFARESTSEEFIIGTENSIVQHLQFECPEKRFYSLSKKAICHDMRMTTLVDVYNAVRGIGGKEILIDEDMIKLARKPINMMIELGK